MRNKFGVHQRNDNVICLLYIFKKVFIQGVRIQNMISVFKRFLIRNKTLWGFLLNNMRVYK